jgi:hypothetical protein
MKPTTVFLYRLTVTILLGTLLLTAVAYRNADTDHREAEQVSMLCQTDAERLRAENTYLRAMNQKLSF